jgi:hypothetical protein
MIRIAALILVVCGGAAYWYLSQPKVVTGPAPITAEAKAYVRNLQLAGVEMKAIESFASQRVVEITGKITNNGGRRLKLVELNCVFADPYGQPVARERVAIVRASKGGLAAGETKSFRLPFDNLPPGWNQALPQLVIAGIEFE